MKDIDDKEYFVKIPYWKWLVIKIGVILGIIGWAVSMLLLFNELGL